MTVQERRERERSEVREKILDAARELFVEHGYDGVSMRQVAKRIDYSPTAIYHHFADKAALFTELCTQDFSRLSASFMKLTEIEDPAERLEACGNGYIEFAVLNPNHYRLMFMTPRPAEVPACDEDMARKGNPNQDSYAFLLSIVQTSLDAGDFRPELTDANLIAQTLWAAVHGVASLQITMSRDKWIDWSPLIERRDLMLNALMRGLMREKE